MKKVSRFSEKVFEQAAGFLRINDGTNILDKTGIHPEAYPIVQKMSDYSKVPINELIGNVKVINSLKVEEFVSGDIGPLAIKDIFNDLKKPGRDPRRRFEVVEFAEGINEISDLKTDMILNGIVTNVTNFGAFVDVGVHTDGLVHTSEISNRFVSDPSEVISVGDRVRVKVIGVDLNKKQISFSIKAALQEEGKLQNKFSASGKDTRTGKTPDSARAASDNRTVRDNRDNRDSRDARDNRDNRERKNFQKPKYDQAKRPLNTSDRQKSSDSQRFQNKQKPGFAPVKPDKTQVKILTSNPFAALTKLIKN